MSLPQDFNQRNILRIIRARQKISAASLARETGLLPSSLVYILRELEKQRLICRDGKGSPSHLGGKPPLLWKIVPDAGSIIGIEILENKSRAVVAGLNGQISLKTEKDFESLNPADFSIMIEELIDELLQENSLKQGKLLYMGITVPGLVDKSGSRILFSAPLKMQDYQPPAFRSLPEGVDIGFVNQARAGALSALWYGGLSVQQSADILCLHISDCAQGLDLGMILHGHLYTGSHGTAGKIAASGPSLWQLAKDNYHRFPADQIRFNTKNNRKSVCFEDLSLALDQSCPLAAWLAEMFTDYIACETERLIRIFNPSQIVIGGELSAWIGFADHYLKPAVFKKFSRSEHGFISLPELSIAKHGVFSPALGATALFLNQLL